MPETLNLADLRRYFLSEKGWEIVEIGTDSVDIRPTVSGTPIRCIDRDFGLTPSGYNPDAVPLSPAWLGAVDGVAAFQRGNIHERMEKGAQITETIGFKAAYHGDYARGTDGCAFRRALIEGRFEGLPPLTRAEHELLATKMGIHYTKLDRPDVSTEPEGFVLNNLRYTAVLPDGGRFYPIELWFAQMAGISSEKALPVIAKCGELLLPQDHKTLFVVRD